MTVRRLSLGMLLLIGGCQPWSRVPMPAPTSLPHKDRVEVWLGGRSVVLRDVVIEPDTIRGRLVRRFPRIPDSAVAVPRASVDSIRLALPDHRNWLGVGFLGGLVVGVAAMFALFASNTT